MNEPSESPVESQGQDLRRLIEGCVEVERWNGTEAECACPLGHEAVVFTNRKYPVLHCFHDKCKDQVVEVNRRLRDAFVEFHQGQGAEIKETPEEKLEREYRGELRDLEARTRHKILPRIKKEPPIGLSDWERASPFDVAAVPVKDHWRLLLGGLFAQEPPTIFGKTPQQVWKDLGEKAPSIDYFLPCIWAGEVDDVGVGNFKTSRQWLRQPACPGPQICPAEFFSSTGGRKASNVQRRDFLVIESDTLPLDKFGNVALFAAEKLKLTLRAVVYTGGKSVHVWFDYQVSKGGVCRVYPEHGQTLAILTGLGCDPNMFGLASTTRMPGLERMDADGNSTGRWQTLIYLNPKFALQHL